MPTVGVDLSASQSAIVSGSGVARLADYAPSLNPEQERHGAQLLESLTGSGSEGRTLQDIKEGLD